MKRKFVNLFIVALMVALCGFAAAGSVGAEESVKLSPEMQWDEANKLYQEKDYKGAVEMYSQLSKTVKKEPALYYNWANASFKEGDIGSAVLNYKRALALDPRSKECRHNLKIAEAKVSIKILDDTPPFLKWFVDKSRYFSEGESINFTLFCYLGLLGFVCLQFFSQSRWMYRMQRLFFLLLILSLVLLGLKLYDLRDRDAVLVTPNIQVKYGPSTEEKTAFKLAGGISVKVVDQVRDWYRIELPNGETGWVKNSELGFID